MSCAAPTAARRVEDLSGPWRFHRGALDRAELPTTPDDAWSVVRVPHDWAIAGPFDAKLPGASGKRDWRGEGWYRRSVTLPKEEAGQRVYLLFDGVMAEPTVYVNGQRAGSWDYGYNGFWVDATKFIKFGEANLIAVHADTTRHESRWYPGGGFYRKATLVVARSVHLEHWGAQVTTVVEDDNTARVTVRTRVRSFLNTPESVDVAIELRGPDGKRVAEPVVKTETIPARGAVVVEQKFKLEKPSLWSPESPSLYAARLSVRQGEETLDRTSEPFGVRKIEFTPNYGFYLNGRRVALRGANLHHDLGPLGAAFSRRALERQLELMKDMGANAIRTSHNPPAPELLELCDRMGLLVFCELFDKWNATADLHDRDQFEPFMRRNVQNFVTRFRNHPSVILWSMSNEDPAILGDTRGGAKGRVEAVLAMFREHDPTRPVTMGCHMTGVLDRDTLDSLDVQSWNYARKYALAKERYPDKPTINSESASALSTRGFYRLPHPKHKTDFDESARQVDSYDLNAAEWADIPDVDFARMERDRFCAGEFVWTGFDYLGEPTPFDDKWSRAKGGDLTLSARSSYFGVVDLCGMPKDRYYLYRSHWAPEKTTLQIAPHWNWPGREGEPVPVYVYTNGEEAELFLNGKSLGRRKKGAEPPAEPPADGRDPWSPGGYYAGLDRYRLRWEDVTYEPGELRAVAYTGGKEFGSATVRTAGAPAALRLTADRDTLRPDGADLSFITVELVDADGAACPLADSNVRYSVTGPAELVAVGNGNPLELSAFDDPNHPLFFGKAVAIVRTKRGAPGEVKVTATAEGVAPGVATLKVK